MTLNTKNICANIYRYKLADNIVSELTAFSKIHQYDDRVTYKEAWNEWLDINKNIVSDEKKRLIDLGYCDNIETKMFKAARYYFRKKLLNKVNKTVEEIDNLEISIDDIDYKCDEIGELDTIDQVHTIVKKKKYISLDMMFLEAIDLHILRNIDNEEYSPAWGWDNFCENNKILVSTEIIRIVKEFNILKDDSINKLKKSYKNKYFQYTRTR